jgi:transposase-like protein
MQTYTFPLMLLYFLTLTTVTHAATPASSPIHQYLLPRNNASVRIWMPPCPNFNSLYQKTAFSTCLLLSHFTFQIQTYGPTDRQTDRQVNKQIRPSLNAFSPYTSCKERIKISHTEVLQWNLGGTYCFNCHYRLQKNVDFLAPELTNFRM